MTVGVIQPFVKATSLWFIILAWQGEGLLEKERNCIV